MSSHSVVDMSPTQFREWCEMYGYSIEEAMPCILSRTQSAWTVDLTSGFFPRVPKHGLVRAERAAFVRVDRNGPGTELHILLSRLGLTATGDCKCTSRARLMDANGCDWCEANIDEIVGWLRESAHERGLPFLDAAGRVLVRRAIANARRKEQARAKEAQAQGGAAAG